MEKKESWSTVGVEGTVLKSQGEEKQPTDSINLINIIVVANYYFKSRLTCLNCPYFFSKSYLSCAASNFCLL